MSFPSAGQYENALLDATGQPAANASVTVYSGWGSSLPTATLYTDQTKTTTASNPVLTDAYGNLGIFAEPGPYTLSYSAGGQAFSIPIIVGPYPADLKMPYGQELAINFTQQTVAVGASYTTGSGGNGNDQITIPGAGWWDVQLCISFQVASGSGIGVLTLLNNGSVVRSWNVLAATAVQSFAVSLAESLAANAVLAVKFATTAASPDPINWAVTNDSNYLMATYRQAAN